MNKLTDLGIHLAFHYTPLHYLPLIGRGGQLLSKPRLSALGYRNTHFRSMSWRKDISRGFGEYVHLTLADFPPILKAKLGAGFPHIALMIPTSALDEKYFGLCRFNVAMTRQLRRDGKLGFPETPENGRYLPGHQIPLAHTTSDQQAMLIASKNNSWMIEVLVPSSLELPEDIRIRCYSDFDARIVEDVLEELGLDWPIEIYSLGHKYPTNENYRNSVIEFIEIALKTPEWKGNGLEFDRV